MKYLSCDKSGCYWVRIVPNKKLLPYLKINSTQYIKSLGVISKSKAEPLAARYISEWLQEIDIASDQLTKPTTHQAYQDDLELTNIVKSYSLLNRKLQDHEWDTLDDWKNNSTSAIELNQRIDTLRLGRGSLSDFNLDEYESTLGHLKPETVNQRINRLKSQFIPAFPYLDENTLTIASVQKWLDSYAKTKPHLAYRTLKEYKNAAHSYIKWLIKSQNIAIHDPFPHVDIPNSFRIRNPNHKTREAFEDYQLSKILSHICSVGNMELYDLVLVAMYTGLRIEESLS